MICVLPSFHFSFSFLVFLQHWHSVRKPNGDRYAYSSHSRAVLDCLRNGSEWSHLIDRGPKVIFLQTTISRESMCMLQVFSQLVYASIVWPTCLVERLRLSSSYFLPELLSNCFGSGYLEAL